MAEACSAVNDNTRNGIVSIALFDVIENSGDAFREGFNKRKYKKVNRWLTFFGGRVLQNREAVHFFVGPDFFFLLSLTFNFC